MKMRMTYWLILLNALLFAIGYSQPLHGMGAEIVAYSFSHANLWHLAINMLALASFALGVEVAWGRWRMLAAYFLSVVMGAAVHVAASDNPVVGSSAGIFGLMIVYAMVYPQRLTFYTVTMRAATITVLTITVLCIVFGIGEKISHWAHMGGMFGGWLAWVVFDIRQMNKALDELSADIEPPVRLSDDQIRANSFMRRGKSRVGQLQEMAENADVMKQWGNPCVRAADEDYRQRRYFGYESNEWKANQALHPLNGKRATFIIEDDSNEK